MVVGQENQPGRKAVLVDVMKGERPPSNAAEDLTVASGPSSVTASRWLLLAGNLTGQNSLTSWKVSGDSMHISKN